MDLIGKNVSVFSFITNTHSADKAKEWKRMDREYLIDLLKELFKDGTIKVIRAKEGNQTKTYIEIDGEWVEQEYVWFN